MEKEFEVGRTWGDGAPSFSDLVGRTLVSVTGGKGDDEVIFTDDQGGVFALRHYQDCCESVSIEDVAGDFSDLIGSPIVRAEENGNEDSDVETEDDDYYESRTWTFYRIATAKGTVAIRFLGVSNGYYSESVDFVCDVAPKKVTPIGG